MANSGSTDQQGVSDALRGCASRQHAILAYGSQWLIQVRPTVPATAAMVPMKSQLF